MTPNDVKIVADNIDDFIEVPDGVARLRKAVLTLAVSGKLVPQNKKEGTGEELYIEIQAHNLNGQKRKKTSILTEDESIPFEIPDSWKWVPLIEIYTSITPPDKLKSTEIVAEGKWPVVDQGEKFISGYTSSAKPIVTDIPVVIFGDHTLNVKFVNFDFVVGADGTKILKPILLDPKYFFLLIQQFTPQSRGYSRHFKQLNHKIVPLPPKEEQKRIVKKVEQVMKQLDELEAKKQERDETRTRLARSALQSLGKGESKIAFEHLTELIHTPVDLKELEGALFTLAVSGKLVPQDKKENTAEELYIRLQKERADQQDVRKKKAIPAISADEIPFEIPNTWKWVKMNDIGETNIGLTYSPTDIHATGTPVLRSTNVQKGQLDLNELVRVKKDVKNSVLVQEGDLLICARNGSKALVGKTAMIRGLKEKMAFGAFMANLEASAIPT